MVLHKRSERSSLPWLQIENSSPQMEESCKAIIQQQPSDAPGTNTGVGCSLLQDFWTPGMEPALYVASALSREVFFFFTTRATWEAFLINQSQECLSSYCDNEQAVYVGAQCGASHTGTIHYNYAQQCY